MGLTDLAGHPAPLPPPEEDPLWFQRAVFYEVLIRGFFDGNNDGVGDIPGLIAKLDYLAVARGGLPLAAALLPVAPPGRRLRHQRLLLGAPRERHGRRPAGGCSTRPTPGASGSSPTWSSTTPATSIRGSSNPGRAATTRRPTGTCGTTTTSGGPRPGWCSSTSSGPTGPTTPERDQYYWHRFYSHQPDLNYDNPEVADAMLDVVRFWLDLGLDGFRLDAVPFLFQRDGTAGREPARDPRLHPPDAGRARRATIPGRILLAEANGWPADVADYFGDGRRVPPVLQLPADAPAVHGRPPRAELSRSPRSWPRPPRPPGSAQWAIFLRNHDELTLEMVTEEERDYLFAEYAKDPRMKRHMGIGRRLAPLLDRDRRLSELLFYLLFTLPGQPGPLLRGRDPDGRQPLPGRPRLGAHAHAVDPGPQRRVQPGRLRPALPAAPDGSGLRLLGGERRGPAAQPELVPALDAADPGRPPRVPGPRHR